MRYTKLFLFFLMTLAVMPARAVEPGYPRQITALNFGTIVQTPNTASTVTLRTNGGLMLSGATSAGGHVVGEILTLKSASLRSETITLSGFAASLTKPAPTCTITVSTHMFDPVTFTDTGLGTSSKWGATASIPANCPAGSYRGIADITATGATTEKQPMQVYITIQAPLMLTKLSDLYFGMMLSPATDGRVYLTAAGVRTASNITLMGTAASAASFQVDGMANTNVTVTMPSDFIITWPGGPLAQGLIVGNFSISPGYVFNLGPSGSATFSLGADLSVRGGAQEGVYSGTFQVSVSY